MGDVQAGLSKLDSDLKLLFKNWDPLSIVGDSNQDEYDSYAVRILGVLVKPTDEITKHREVFGAINKFLRIWMEIPPSEDFVTENKLADDIMNSWKTFLENIND